jgi:hypothetical protein
MRRTLARSVAWTSWMLSTVLLIAGALLRSGSAPYAAPIIVSGAAYATVALVLALKRPDNPFHWVLGVIGLSLAGLSASSAYTTRLGADPDLLVASIWLNSWLYVPGFVTALILPPLLFPSGRPPSRRWLPVFWIALLVLVVATAAEMFAPGPLYNGAPIDNPLGIAGPVGEAMTTVVVVVPLLLLACVVLSCAAFVVRMRQSRGVERAQLKWFAYTAAIMAIGFALTIGLYLLGWRTQFFTDLYLLALGALPIAIAVAILRHRLYDIDVLINRTLVYGATTAAIASTFFLGILTLTQVLRPITQGSEVAVAVSTLASFALFQPIRRRVQDAVDRRFHRSRYDAWRTLDTFADQLRDEVDLDTLRTDLIDVVRQTMVPAHASLWLRERPSAVTIPGRS